MRPPSPLTRWRPNLALLAALLFMTGGELSWAAPPQPRVFTARVVGVSDGDTLTVLENKKQWKVRLYGIDTPEKKQAFGTKAKQFTSGLAFGKEVEVTVVSKDRYGRLVGIVRLPDGRNLNQELVKNGYAWWYSHFAPKDTELRELEQRARAGKRQLWSQPNAVPPWEFRRSKKQKEQALSL